MFRGIGAGQNTALTLLLLVAAWRASAADRDGLAGVFLGLLLFKPQFAVLAVALWAVHRPVAHRRRRSPPSPPARGRSPPLFAGADWVSRWLDDVRAYDATEDVNAPNHVSLPEAAHAAFELSTIGWFLAGAIGERHRVAVVAHPRDRPRPRRPRHPAVRRPRRLLRRRPHAAARRRAAARRPGGHRRPLRRRLPRAAQGAARLEPARARPARLVGGSRCAAPQSRSPPDASCTDCFPALIHGIIPRSSSPTASIWWALPASRSSWKFARPPRDSAIHSSANLPALDLREDLLHLRLRLVGDDARAAGHVAVLGGVGDRVAHAGDALLVHEVDDELHLVQALEVRRLGLVAGLDERLEPGPHERR